MPAFSGDFSGEKPWIFRPFHGAPQVMITVGSIYWTLETEEVLTATDGNKARESLDSTLRRSVNPRCPFQFGVVSPCLMSSTPYFYSVSASFFILLLL
jgi:hypothetical protein